MSKKQDVERRGVGRPRKPDQFTKHINLQLNEEEYKKLTYIADTKGISMSQVLRNLLKDYKDCK